MSSSSAIEQFAYLLRGLGLSGSTTEAGRLARGDGKTGIHFSNRVKLGAHPLIKLLRHLPARILESISFPRLVLDDPPGRVRPGNTHLVDLYGP